MSAEARYRRLLAAYPARWRAADHDVLLGILLDTAETAGRDRPTPGEARSIVVHGLAGRLDRRVAVRSAAAATVLGLAAAAALIAPVALQGWTLGSWGMAAALGVCPALLATTVAALLHVRRLIPAAVALALPVAGAVSGAAGAAAIELWSLGFDAADAGRQAPPGSQLAMAGAAVVAWVLAAGVLGAVLFAVLRGLPRPLRAGLALLGVVLAPAAGLTFLQPGGAVLVASGVLMLAVLLGREPAPSAPPAAAIVRDANPAAARLAIAGTAAAIAGAVLAFAGGPLGLFGLDGTGAMGLGLDVGAAAGVVVLAAATRLTPFWRPFPRASTALIATGLAINIVSRSSGAFPGDLLSTAVLLASAALLALGLALLLQPRLPAPRPLIVGAIAVGALAAGGVLAAAAAGFVVPVAGAIVTLRLRRPTRLPEARPA